MAKVHVKAARLFANFSDLLQVRLCRALRVGCCGLARRSSLLVAALH